MQKKKSEDFEIRHFTITNLNELIEELYALYETEKYFKKQSKKGYSAVVEVHYIKRMDDFFKNYDPKKKDCMFAFAKWDDNAKEQLLKKY